MSDVITIGIAGGTGSGKTTITRRILDEFGGDVSVLYHDNYYKRRVERIRVVVVEFFALGEGNVVVPSKRYADIIIPEGGHNQVALDFVMERIRAYVKERD